MHRNNTGVMKERIVCLDDDGEEEEEKRGELLPAWLPYLLRTNVLNIHYK